MELAYARVGIVSARVQVAGSTAGDFNARTAVRLDAEAAAGNVSASFVPFASRWTRFRGISIASITTEAFSLSARFVLSRIARIEQRGEERQRTN